MLLAPESVNATFVKENSLSIIFVSLFGKITLSIKLKEFYLLLSILLLLIFVVTSLYVGG